MKIIQSLPTVGNPSMDFAIVKEDDGTLLVRRINNGETAYFEFNPQFKAKYNKETSYLKGQLKMAIMKAVKEENPEIYSQSGFGASSDSTPRAVTPAVQTTVDMKSIETAIAEGFKQAQASNPYESAIIEGIISKAKGLSTESLLNEAKAGIDNFIREEYGALPKKIRIEANGKRNDVTGIFHEKFETLLKIVERNIPLMLVGPAGSGKNHTLEQVAEALGLNFYFTNAVTQEYKITGFIDANGNYHETEFYKAFKHGGLFFLDEMDASIPEVLLILNAAIANRYFDFPNGRIDAHADFRVVSASNTTGTGADMQYVGRNQLDAATLDRFAQCEFNYDPIIESQLAVSPELYEFIIDLRNAVAKNDMRYVVSMRATINASKLDDVLSTKELIEMVILKGMPKDDMRLLSTTKSNKYHLALREVVK